MRRNTGCRGASATRASRPDSDVTSKKGRVIGLRTVVWKAFGKVWKQDLQLRPTSDEFSIPGSDAQKAIDLIESQFTSEQGGVLNLVFAAPKGERLDTPVILMTGSGDGELIARALDLGAASVLHKPYSSGWFEAVVGEALGGVPAAA